MEIITMYDTQSFFRLKLKKLLTSFLIVASLMMHPTLGTAATVSTTVFGGSNFNLMTDIFGKQWLSLLATDGLSYSFVSDRINNNIGDYANFRFATQNEVHALFTDYGAPDIDVGATDDNFAPALQLQDDFGSSGSISLGEPLTFGYTSTILVQKGVSFPNYRAIPFVKVQTDKGEATFRTQLYTNVFSDPHAHLKGSWLIQDVATVPLPSSLYLFLTGIVFLLISQVFQRRRRTVSV